MRKLALVILIIALAGCLGSGGDKPAQKDTELLPPTVTPSGYVTTRSVTVTAAFAESVILSAFEINGETPNVTRIDEKTYRLSKDFADGSYTVFVSATDAAGNAVDYTTNFTVDATAPTLTLEPEDGAQLTSNDVDFTISSSEAVEITSSTLGTAALDFTTSDSWVFTASKHVEYGSYTLSVSAKDRAGNVATASSSFSIAPYVPDNTAPPQITGVAAEPTGNTGEIIVAWAASTASDFKEYRIYRSSAELTSVSSRDYSYTVTAKATTSKLVVGLADGTRYCFAVTAADRSDNEDKTVVSACATPAILDLTPPVVTDTLPTGTVATNKPLIQVTTNEKASCRYAIDASGEKAWNYSNLTGALDADSAKTTHKKTHTALSNGTYYAYVICNDTSNNAMVAAEQWSFTVAFADASAPSVTITSPGAGPYNTTTLALGFLVSDNADPSPTCKYSLNGSVPASASNTTTLSSLADGLHDLYVNCTDSSSNVGIAHTTFTVDTTKPAQVLNLVNTTATSSSITLGWDAIVDATSYRIYRNSTFLTSTAANIHSDSGLANATLYVYQVSAVDAAGNEGDKSAELSVTTEA